MLILTKLINITVNYYRPKRSFGQGNIFRSVCHSVHRGGVCSKFSGGGGCLLQILGGCLLQILGGVCSKFWGVSAPNFGGGWGVCVSAPNFWGDVCSKFLGGCLLQIFLGGSPIFGIRSTFGRYASYWNAFLFLWKKAVRFSRVFTVSKFDVTWTHSVLWVNSVRISWRICSILLHVSSPIGFLASLISKLSRVLLQPASVILLVIIVTKIISWMVFSNRKLR